MKDLLVTFRNNALRLSTQLDADCLCLRGVSRTEFVLRLHPDNHCFHLHYLVAQTIGYGCSYFDPRYDDVAVTPFYVGKNVLALQDEPRCLRIAALDALYSHLRPEPSERHILSGSSLEKARLRADLIREEIRRIAKTSQPKIGKRLVILNVGVVADFLRTLRLSEEFDLIATDFAEDLSNRTIEGVQIRHGSNTERLIETSDIALVTGMTLATGTLGDVIELAARHRTPIVLFAETGANFAAEYCRLGVNTVLSEPFPFYLISDADTTLDIYRIDAVEEMMGDGEPRTSHT